MRAVLPVSRLVICLAVLFAPAAAAIQIRRRSRAPIRNLVSAWFAPFCWVAERADADAPAPFGHFLLFPIGPLGACRTFVRGAPRFLFFLSRKNCLK